jgi:hypothetical protein
MTDFAQIVDAFGGPADLARLMSRPYDTVQKWRYRNSIPPDAWSEIETLASSKKLRGITIRVMARLASRDTHNDARDEAEARA